MKRYQLVETEEEYKEFIVPFVKCYGKLFLHVKTRNNCTNESIFEGMKDLVFALHLEYSSEVAKKEKKK